MAVERIHHLYREQSYGGKNHSSKILCSKDEQISTLNKSKSYYIKEKKKKLAIEK